MSYDQVAGASSGDDAFLGGASQGGRGIRKVVKWTFELRTEFATSFKFRKVFDSCPVGVSADSCPAGAPLIEGVINKIYNLLHHILG